MKQRVEKPADICWLLQYYLEDPHAPGAFVFYQDFADKSLAIRRMLQAGTLWGSRILNSI